MKVLYTGLLLILFILTSCQSDSKSTQIEDKKTTYANFYLRYLQPEGKVKGEAYFKLGKTTKEQTAIEFENGIFFDGGSMILKNAVGRKLYRSERSGEFKSSYKFEINPKGTDTYQHVVNINPIFSFKIKNGISKSNGFELKWEGSNLSKDEELVLLFTDEKNRAVNIEINGPTESQSVIISKKKLSNLKLGKGALYLVRKLKDEQKNGNKISLSVSEFYTKSIDVEVAK